MEPPQRGGMDVRDVLDSMGVPNKINPPEDDRLRSRKWKCSACFTVHTSDAPVTAPGPCTECGGRFLETVDVTGGHGPAGSHARLGAVLVVESSASLRTDVAALLSGLGAAVTMADSEAEAARLLRGNRYDLLVVGLSLRDGTGMDAVRAAGKAHRAMVPFLLITGGWDLPALAEALTTDLGLLKYAGSLGSGC